MEFIDLKAQQRRIEADLRRRMDTVLSHGRYIMGPEIEELEAALADFVGVRHCVAVGSGTDALSLAMMGLGIGPGDEVITTPFTFFATAETISLLGASPVFVDIDPKTYTLDTARLADVCTERTKAILPVSLYGQCANMNAICEVARTHGDIPVIEDGAQSLGATHHGRQSCGLSLLGTTSFFPSKPLGCYGDGGAVFTSDDGLAVVLRELRVHGQSARYEHSRIGLCSRLDTLQAAVLMAKLQVFEDELVRRQEVGARYSELLDNLNVVTPYVEPHNRSVFAQYTIRVNDRERVAKGLRDAGIPTAVHYPKAIHQQPVYGQQRTDLAHSETAVDEVLSLPMGPYLDHLDQNLVVERLSDLIP